MQAPDGIADAATLDALSRLVAVMARLRAPVGGCPWDVEQTFASVAPHTIEEAYEVADAIERGDLGGLREELGDLLLQVVFHSRMAEEQGAFALREVAEGIVDKLVRRHPHVFGDTVVADADEQTRLWEEGKAAERAAAGEADLSVLAGIARGLPEWLRAIKLQKRAARVGFDWPDAAPVFDKLHEEIDELRVEFAAVDRDSEAGRQRLQDELGDVLFVVSNLARHAGVDPGAALRGANAKFERRFRRMEQFAAQRNIALSSLALAEQDQLWDEAKREERAARPVSDR